MNRADIETVLAEHRWNRGTAYWGCPCGARCPDPLRGAAHRTKWMRSHVADQLMPLFAAVWEEGQQAGYRFYRENVTFSKRDKNPYRAGGKP